MRLPTVTQFRLQMNALAKQYDDVNTLQQQTTSGQKIQRSSENPLLADKINAIKDAMQLGKGYDLNTTLANNRVSQMSTSMQQTVNIMHQVKDRVLSAQNDTMSNENRASIAKELEGYAETLLGIVNTQDSNGEYLFSGINSATQPYLSGENGFRYQGASEITRIALASHAMIPLNDSGFRVFGDIKTGNGVYEVRSDVQNNTGSGVASAAGLSGTSALIMDDYTVTFVTNLAGELAYTVSGASTGQVIPAPPLNMPDDAPAYSPGDNIFFNGINMQISGKPDVGDTFMVSESKTQNVLDTLQSIINILKTPVTSEKERADLHQLLGEQGSTLGQSLGHFLEYSTELGNRGKTVDDQIMMAQNAVRDQNILLNRLSSTPIEEVLPKLSERLLTMELTQQSYVKIQDSLQRIFSNVL